MFFLNPIFALAGAGLIAIPIIIHLLNRRRFKLVEWAAMHYLLAALRKNRRRLQLESLLLLLVRCAALLLLGVALARPLGCGGSAAAAIAAQQVGLSVIIIDDSYSMAYQADRPDARTHLEQAKQLLRQLAQRVGEGSQEIAVITASRPARVLVRPTFNQQAVLDAVERLPQSSAATDLPEALRLAQQIGSERANLPSRTLFVLSDCTASALRGRSAEPLASLGPELARSFRVVVHDLSRANQSNVALTDLSTSDVLVRVGFGSDLQARVLGFGAPTAARVAWNAGGQPLPESEALTPDPQSPPVVQSQAPFDAAGPVVVRTTLNADDRLALDNERLRVVDVVGEMPILIVEGRRGIGALQGSGAFLRFALAPPSAGASTQPSEGVSRYLAPRAISDLELATIALGDYPVVILAGVGSIRPEIAAALKAYVEQGGSLVLFMGERVGSDNYNQTLGNAGLLPGSLVARVDSSAGEQGYLFDFNARNPHPVLNLFRDQEKTGLESVRVFSYWRTQLDPNRSAQRVLSFRGSGEGELGDPAITLHTLGLGRVLFVATSADAEWSTFVARPSAYVTLMHELIAAAAGRGDAWMNLEVGDRVIIPSAVRLTSSPVLLGPAEQSQPLEQAALSADQPLRWASQPLRAPGMYTLVAGERRFPIAVNVPAADEADIRPVGAAGISTALGEITLEIHGDSLDPQALTQDAAADFAWPLLLLLLPLLFAESAMAWKFGRSRGSH